MIKRNSAFSLIELSIVVLIIGIIIAGVTQSTSLVSKMRLAMARSLTTSSPVNGIKDLILWLDASSQSSISSSLQNGDKVAQWNDMSTQAITKVNLIQTNADYQPTYTTNGIGGIPTLSFSTNDSLSFYNFPISSANYSMFVVFNTSGSSSNQEILCVFYDSNTDNEDNSSFNGSVLEIRTGNQVRTVYRSNPMGSSGGDSNASTLAITNGLNYVLSYVRNLSSSKESLWMNNTAFIGSGATIPVVTNAFFENPLSIVVGKLNDNNSTSVATARTFNGQISEIIIYDRALTQEETDSVEKYLSQKYSIKLN